MSPPAAAQSGSHESSVNWPSLRDNKSDVSVAYFADLVQRRRLCLGCRNTGTGARSIQTEGCAFNSFLIPRRGGKLRKKFRMCRECSKVPNFDHCEIKAVILCPARLANEARGFRYAHIRGPSNYSLLQHPLASYDRKLLGIVISTHDCMNLAQKLTLGLHLANVPAWKGFWDNINQEVSLAGSEVQRCLAVFSLFFSRVEVGAGM